MPVLFASQQSQLTAFVVVVVLGLAVGVLGHMTGSRPLILLGILLIGLSTAYFSFLLRPGSG
jgi:F0F1-type ATP synthase assembly protein I